jgi:hypothetical protein
VAQIEDPPAPVPTPVLTLTQAAQACRMSRMAVRRYLESNRLPNSFRAHDNSWRIPVTDLITAGLRPIRATRADEPLVQRLATELDRLRAENALLRERLASSQAIARERELAIEDLRFAMRMLPEAWAQKLAKGDQERAALGAETLPQSAVAEALQRVRALEEELLNERAERDRLMQELQRPRHWWRRARRSPEDLSPNA